MEAKVIEAKQKVNASSSDSDIGPSNLFICFYQYNEKHSPEPWSLLVARKHLCVPEQRGYFSKVNASVCSHVMLPWSKVPLLEVILQKQSDVQTRGNGKAVGADGQSALFEKCVLVHLFDVGNHRKRMSITA